MRLKVKDGEDGELELVKFDVDGGFDALLDAIAGKLGYLPQALYVDGARIRSVDDLEETDVIAASREEAISRKRTADGEPVASTGASANAASTSAAGTSAAASSDAMEIVLQDREGAAVHFKVKPKTKLTKILKAYNERQNVQPQTYRFIDPDGERIPETTEDTVEDRGLENGDTIDVFQEFTGGGRPVAVGPLARGR